MTADFDFSPRSYRDTRMPDPAAFPEVYEGVLWRRVTAYLVDLFCIGVIAVGVWMVFAKHHPRRPAARSSRCSAPGCESSPIWRLPRMRA